MPKVGSVRLKCNTEFPVSYELHYTRDKKFHVKGLPKDFFTIVRAEECYYETEEKCVESMESACREYRKVKTNSKLVILYSASASAELRMNKSGVGSYVGLLPGVSRKINSIDTGLNSVFGVDYVLAMCIDNGAEKRFLRVDVDTKEVTGNTLRFGNSYQSMDYTESRWEFFVGIGEAMKSIVVKMSKLFDLEDEEVCKFIDRNSAKFLTH